MKTKREKDYLYLNDKLRITYDNIQWILESGRKKKNSEEISWTAIKWFGRFTQLCEECIDLVSKDDFGYFTKFKETHNQTIEQIKKLQQMIINDSTPTVLRERIIKEYHIEVVKEDKRTLSGFKHIENKIEKEIIKDDISEIEEKETGFDFL